MLQHTHTTPLAPFGLKIEAEHPTTALASLDISTLRELVLEHRVLVLRGFAPLDRQAYESYTGGWGEILRWNFGAILDVVVDPNAQNYLFTNGSVPHHWDGAFAATVPFLQIFQCLAAPGTPNTAAARGGETVFCDTTRVWKAATGAQKAAWEHTAITYHTEKIAHYGGQIHAGLVATHPQTRETTLRFAEPPDADTAALNPLHLEVEGNTLEALMEQLQPLLYNDDFCYFHDWREGDYVIADNHALLHARKAFQPGAARHLQRIHIK